MFIPGVRGFGTQATSLPLHRLQDAISPAICSLQNQGYAVIDNIFGAEIALQLRDEVKALRNYMHKNCTHLIDASGTRSLVPKKDIFEAELMRPETQALAPMCSLLQNTDSLRQALSPALPTPTHSSTAAATTATTTAHPPRYLSHQAIKLQWNAGDGGCFPMHFDTDSSVDNRVITAIWYQNPNWQPKDGGQLRLFPFPRGPPVDISPVLDRMVLFSSGKMVHRVLPSFTDRYCFTIWLSGSSQSASPEKNEEQRALVRAGLGGKQPGEFLSEEEALRLLEIEELRRHAIKWVYREEWEQSLLESHPAGLERDELINKMKFEIEVIERALRPMLPFLSEWSSRNGNGGENGGEKLVGDCKIEWI
jgi:Rps23 Pro-64 3,4-dihydroxylase Tpa1-like proline 4-hydroxylase